MNDKILTKEEQETNLETKAHIANVQKFIDVFIEALNRRSVNHDFTKLEDPELSLFTKYTKLLATCTYGSDEYKKFLAELKPALDHHYAINRHHPEHFPDGIEGMNLIDLVEMFCDWKAATLRHRDGNLLKSVDINTDRFNIDPQLSKILENTVELFDNIK